MEYGEVSALADRIGKNIGKVIVGKEAQIELVLVALLAGGHVLLEDVPGTGKTMLLRTFSKTVGGNFKRIQEMTERIGVTGRSYDIQPIDDSTNVVYRVARVMATLHLFR